MQENFYEKLVEYFKNTPREKVLEDWEKSAHLDDIKPTVDEFLENTNKQQIRIDYKKSDKEITETQCKRSEYRLYKEKIRISN